MVPPSGATSGQIACIPLTTKIINFVGSSCKALDRNYRQPTKQMVWVVKGSLPNFTQLQLEGPLQ